MCILCRKKQELVVKTGKWIIPPLVGGTMHQQQQQQHQFSGVAGGVGNSSSSSALLLTNDKRPRLERALSYDRDNSSGGGGGYTLNRLSTTASMTSKAYPPPSSSLGGGAPSQQLQPQQHGPLQRSGSLQSHGPSSWRPLSSSDALNPIASRGTVSISRTIPTPSHLGPISA